ncbi:hypothetical protein [Halogeometricum sp. CBA1124]|uniref:hypothetical protein n=1 Tax=Halogeometricum sp. CBA1124 TaxID=2668071 RepID=UPI0018D26CD3|nr:hypothetical protein [Halogeometricum sp. CBA1124]
MVCAKMRKLWYGFLVAYGLVTVVAPRIVTRLSVRKGLRGFENTEELEPTDWYVRAVRASGVGMLAAGGTGLLLEGRAEAREATADVEAGDETAVAETTDDEADDDDGTTDDESV